MDNSAGVRRLVANAPVLAATSLVWLALAIKLALTTIAAWIAFQDAPFADYWNWIGRAGGLSDLFARNYEHPIVTGRIFFWLDWSLFDGRGRFTQLMAILIIAAQIPAFVWLARLANAPVPVRIVLPIAATLVLGVSGWENMTQPFQVTFVPIYPLALWSIAALVSHLQQPKPWKLALCFGLLVLALVSMSTAVFLPLVLGAMTAWLKRWRLTAAFAAIAIVAWTLQILEPDGRHALRWVALITADQMLRFFLILLGTPVAGTISPVPGYSSDAGLSLMVGVVVLLLSLASIAWAVIAGRKNPACLGLAAAITFFLMTAALTTAGRFVLGPQYALTGRYYTNTAALWTSVIITALVAANDFRSRNVNARLPLAIAGPVAAALLVAMSAASARALNMLYDYHRAFLGGVTTMVSGVFDGLSWTHLLGMLPIEVGHAGAAKLLQDGKWTYADPVTRRMGGQLAPDELKTPACGDGETHATPPDAINPFYGMRGSFARQGDFAGASHVLVTDAGGRIVGYGRVPRRPSDLNPFARGDGRPVDWQGHAQPDATGPFGIWLSDATRIRCALTSPSSAPTPPA
jgi:hypothetical protein